MNMDMVMDVHMEYRGFAAPSTYSKRGTGEKMEWGLDAVIP